MTNKREPLSQSKRREVLERNNYRCQECNDVVGSAENPHIKSAEIHHKRPVSEDGTNLLSNLLTLCQTCHRLKHANNRETDSSQQRRALMTQRERKVILGEGDVRKEYQYQTVSRVRRRINEELVKDLKVFAEHGGLLEDFRYVACTEFDD